MDGAFAAVAETLKLIEPGGHFYFALARRLFKGSAHTSDPLTDFLGWMRLLGAKTFLEEQLDIASSDELQYELQTATARAGGTVSLTATRLTFFSEGAAGTDWSKADFIPDHSLLGYAVVLSYQILGCTVCCLHEAVVRWDDAPDSKRLSNRENYFVHCVRDHKTQVGTKTQCRPLSVVGSFFAQANGFTSVCAHGAIRTALNSTPNIRLGKNGNNQHDYRKITNRDINESLKIDFTCVEFKFGQIGDERRNPDALEGLSATQMNTAVQTITGHQFRLLAYETHYQMGADFDRFVYPHMESAYPVILGINGWDFDRRTFIKHVVTIIGHTLNADRWAPEANACYGQQHFDGFHWACDWTDHYVCNDDRHGIYATIQSDILRPTMLPTRNPYIHPILALALVPNSFAIPAHTLEAYAIAVFNEFLRDRKHYAKELTQWETEIHSLMEGASREASIAPVFVVRTTICQRADYIASICKQTSRHLSAEQEAALAKLPELLAVCEVTLPSLYTVDMQKFGEVVFDVAPVSSIDYQGDAGEAMIGAARLMWFDGLWQTRDGGGEDWPLTGLQSLIEL